jgi:hypothetical protein
MSAGFFWYDRFQDGLRDAKISAASGKAALRRVPTLEHQIDKLVLACMAMWSILQEKHGLSEADLVKRMQEIDLADGEADGKLGATPLVCRDCKRVVSVRFPRCVYCNSESLEPSAFQGLERPGPAKPPLKTPRRKPR